MDTSSVIAQIDEEIARLEQARAAIAGLITTAAAVATKQPAKRELSAKARKAIADAQRRRWAGVKAEKAAKLAPAKKAGKKVPAKKPAAKPRKAPAKAKKAVAKKVVPASVAATS
jgi:hypothetical protein